MEVFLVIAGFLVGTAVGATAIGAGLVTVPFLMLLGIRPTEAVGTALAINLATRLVAAWQHSRQKTVHYGWVASIALGSIPSAILTIVLLSFFKAKMSVESLDTTVAKVVGAMLVIMSLVGIFSEFAMHRQKLGKPLSLKLCEGWKGRALAFLTGAFAGASTTSTGIGAVNGICIAYLRLPPVIVTLATMALFRGLAIGWTRGEKVSGFPQAFIELGQGQFFGIIPKQLPLLLLLAVAAWFVLHRTVWGRNIFAVGANETAAKFSGVPVETTKFWLYVVSGLMASLAGVLYVARFNTAKADAAMGAELDVITAALLGGTPITGGEGSLVGTMLALLLLSTLRRGLDMAQVGVEQQAILIGAILIAAVAFSQRTLSLPMGRRKVAKTSSD